MIPLKESVFCVQGGFPSRTFWLKLLERDTQVKYAIKYLLRLERMNLRLIKFFFILRSQNEERRPTCSEILNEFKKMIEQIEEWFQKIPRESELIPRLARQSSIVNCSKDYILRVEKMKSILPEQFFKKIAKVAHLMHYYPESEPVIGSDSCVSWTNDTEPTYSEPWMC